MIRTVTLALAGSLLATTAIAEEVNIYSYRQPELIQPILDAFTEETGITTNVAYIYTGLVERLQAEGARSPADIIMTVDISRLAAAKDAGVTQAVDDEALKAAVPANLRDDDGHWYGLTTRARIVYASNRAGPFNQELHQVPAKRLRQRPCGALPVACLNRVG